MAIESDANVNDLSTNAYKKNKFLILSGNYSRLGWNWAEIDVWNPEIILFNALSSLHILFQVP